MVLARLARVVTAAPVARGARVGEGADAGADEAADEPLDSDDDSVDDALATRTALAAALASYTAVHGHPLEVVDAEPPRRFRVAVGVRVALGAVVALALVVGAVAVRVWQRAPATGVPVAVVAESPGAAAVGPATPSGGTGAEVAGAATTTQVGGPASAMVVHVVGEVASPGVVSVPAGARVADALAAAGGATATADLEAINLARVLTDGEQVVVPAPGEAAVGGAAGSGGASDDSGLVDLNRADATGFDTLPGIGPVLAERIVAWREEHGRFTAVEELTEVSGIGPALLSGLRDLVRVG